MENLFTNKQFPYHTLSDYYKDTFGEKVYKLAIDGGFTCPNRDGTIHDKGCIFCSESGSGDFAANRNLDMRERVLKAKELLSSKTKAKKFIVYFQSFTNTYDTVEHLKIIYESAIIDDSIVGLSIATRPDCLSDDVILLLKDLNTKLKVYIELGLQSIHQRTAAFIRRGYPLSVYDLALTKLKEAGLPVITHVIIGLPGETKEDILETVNYVAATHTHGIKLQLLHILKDTDLHTYYNKHPFKIFTLKEYIDLVQASIRCLPPETVLYRLTGDGPKDLLIEPMWSLDKRKVLGTIAKELKATGSYQGQDFKGDNND